MKGRQLGLSRPTSVYEEVSIMQPATQDITYVNHTWPDGEDGNAILPFLTGYRPGQAVHTSLGHRVQAPSLVASGGSSRGDEDHSTLGLAEVGKRRLEKIDGRKEVSLDVWNKSIQLNVPNFGCEVSPDVHMQVDHTYRRGLCYLH